MPARLWLGLGAILVISAAVLAAAYGGFYGPLVTCGVDQAAVCVAWPRALSGVVWVLFIAFFAGLLCWQVATWRQPPEQLSARRDRDPE